ncbi:efflux RND transporter permease subunit [Paraglaciecola sp. Hal342]
MASITTVAAFIPLFLVDGDEGEYGFALGAVVALMLIGSWLTAMYILPALSVWFSKNTQQTSTEAEPSALIRIYEALLKKSMPLSIIVVIGSYVLVVASSMLFGSVKNEMFPLSARSQYLIYMDMPKGTSIQETERNALAIEKWLSDQTVNPEVKNSTMYIGDGGPRFYLALNPADTNPSSAFILVNTHDFEGAVVAANRARSYLVRRISHSSR